MGKIINGFYEFECTIFRKINRHFDKKSVNVFFQYLTHFGGATFTIFSVLILLVLSSNPLKLSAIASLIALTLSHIPVALAKKFYPRKRPYLALDKIRVTSNPLKDHSFPSGHTTAIFSVITPLILSFPVLAFILIPLALLVGISRIYLGLHYPSDVAAGMILGSGTGVLTFIFIHFQIIL
ncbi:phosphatase PAP2 family protein [Sutcliffiella rhizosphaerae]|uniref:Phosphatidic acid phosphatase type 2/haloperoxidase domain-containing protein n=1 Tax=Sutcliffiella rhizosphaerae TaxID=2880967 RepID=A0ABM8YR23_9BACI|nr:phosphatase PAP2 family protein [Sutcliffiella rhizosphaerae]CAG9622441.1 hypothetical protein BACCIP111883_03232 [Sutcliffiella rhizosphaerae]